VNESDAVKTWEVHMKKRLLSLLVFCLGADRLVASETPVQIAVLGDSAALSASVEKGTRYADWVRERVRGGGLTKAEALDPPPNVIVVAFGRDDASACSRAT